MEWQAGNVSGLTVHIGARVAAKAGTGELRDLVTGSGLPFAEHCEHMLKGIADTWTLFVIESR